ncbi:MAG: hypothetical protein ACLRIS_11795 [Flavonifractor plautii]
MTRCLPLFHDIRGSFDREPGTPSTWWSSSRSSTSGHHGAGHRRLCQNAGAGGIAFPP